jgi:hypothetical protein
METPIVWAGMATLPERNIGRMAAMESILPQVERLTISPGKNIGDQIKFASCPDAPEYFISIDDDLIYPETFVHDTLEALSRHPGCIVTYGGWSVNNKGNLIENQRALVGLDSEVQVQIGHTYGMCFHTDTIKFYPEDFPVLNLVDVYVAIKAWVNKVPIIVLPHAEDYFTYIQPPTTIWDETQEQTGSFLDVSKKKKIGVQQLIELIYG